MTAFASPTAGWAFVGAPAVCRLLYTDDGGTTWRTQLAWEGSILGRLAAFSACEAGLALGLTPRADSLNGCPVGNGDYTAVFARTHDGGATWTVTSPPDPIKTFTGLFHYRTPRHLWAVMQPFGYPTTRLVAQTKDGGASWQLARSHADLPPTRIAFSSPADGVAVAGDGLHSDTLYVTGDGGGTWSRTVLPPPPVPSNAVVTLSPVVRAGTPMLLLMRVEPDARQAPAGWTGTYAYLREGQEWSGPHRLPRTHAGPELAVVGADGRFWAASGQDLWVADTLAGPWEHRRVPLPGEHLRTPPWDLRLVPLPSLEVIADIAPFDNGVVWLTTTHGAPVGAVPSGQLYRSEDDGVHWTRLAVESRRLGPKCTRA
ncbi:hypothetical protein Raf01_50400 [Rugosimonospora africana]|uniref:Uncharacterized protein n=1 Tax=Rugosimonospora africana TaxID=556532 RepID=A0A8J3QW30_9ACTN|nr:hypothetical protein Raf01_50400 [Rugosimonospora africana]